VAAEAGPGQNGTLEDETPVDRGWMIGMLVSATGTLDRAKGTVTIVFNAPVSAAARAATPQMLLSPTTLSTLGPGEVKLSWLNTSAVVIELPPAHQTDICAAWRDVRATAAAEGSGTAALPPDLTLSFAEPGMMFDADAGFVYDGTARVHMGSTEGTPVISLNGPADVGGCQDLRLDVARSDGAWDGVLQWSLAAMMNSSDGAPLSVGNSEAPLVDFLERESRGRAWHIMPATSLCTVVLS